MNRFHLLVGALVVAGACSVVAGCSSGGSNPSPEVDPRTGAIALALSAVGPDGATYTLTSADLSVSWTGSAGAGSQTLFFNSSPGSESFTVPVGTYTATLQGGIPDAQAGWTLSRASDAGPTTVSAALLDPQPYTFSIASGGTTNLPMHFEIANVGNVTFAAGTLVTSLSVNAGTFPANHALVGGSATFAQSVTTGIPSLASLLNVSPTAPQTVPVALALNLTSAFAFTPTNACASISGSVVATMSPDAGVEDSVAALLDEASQGTGYLCFLPSGGYSLILQRQGPPETATYQTALGATSDDTYTFEISGTQTPPILNGATLNLSQLAQPTTLAGAQVQMSVQPGPGQSGDGISSGSSSVTLQVTP